MRGVPGKEPGGRGGSNEVREYGGNGDVLRRADRLAAGNLPGEWSPGKGDP